MIICHCSFDSTRATQVISTSVWPSLRSISVLAIFNIFSTFPSGGSLKTCQWQRVPDTFCFGKLQGTWIHKSKFQIIPKEFQIISKLFSGGSYRTCQWQRTECVRHLLLWQTPGNLGTSLRIQSRPRYLQSSSYCRAHLVSASWTLLNPQTINSHILIQNNHALHHWSTSSFLWQNCLCTQHPCPQNPHDILN